VFGAETVFAATLPLYGADLPFADPVMIGLALSLSSGVGFLLLPFFVDWMDGGRLRTLMLLVSVSMVLSCVLVKEAPTLGPAALLLGSLGFGAARVVGVVGLLTMIARLPGTRTVNQGWNGALQRLGSLVALLCSGLLLATGNWSGVFVMLIAMISVWWLMADRAARFADLSSGWSRPRRAGRGARGWGQVTLACLIALRRPRVLAAAALNVLNVTAFMNGNAFVSMAFAPELGGAAITALVVTSVVLRDGVAVLSGLVFPVVLRLVGSRAVIWGLALLAIVPVLLIVVLPEAVLPVGYLAAVLHGALVGGGSAAANLLAAGPHRAGAGLRITASQLPCGIVMIAAPFLFGGAVVGLGVQAAYALVLAVMVAGGWIMVRASRGVDLAA
jgi:hypothetical protein